MSTPPEVIEIVFDSLEQINRSIQYHEESLKTAQEKADQLIAHAKEKIEVLNVKKAELLEFVGERELAEGMKEVRKQRRENMKKDPIDYAAIDWNRMSEIAGVKANKAKHSMTMSDFRAIKNLVGRPY